ncbi:MAG TPA: helix-turn-helix domain-containing protein [Ornithinibacter sp.]|nr:helix-turn-helix domain-containing protein [Ornithinibacter sp.]
MTSTRPHAEDREVWLGVHEASEMLGVSTATLRRWSVAGKIETFTTPGGHRRYARSTLEHLLPRAAGGEQSLASLGGSADRVVEVLRANIAAVCPDVSWLDGADQQTLSGLALAGRAMVDGVLGYVDGASRREREAALAPALRAAELHGRLAERRGGNLGETVATFQRCRSLLLDLLGELACRHGLGTPAATRMLARANDAGDRLVVALVSAHTGASQARAALGV